jgi:hypothetical protein
MRRDLMPLVRDQRAAVQRARAQLDDLDRQLAALESALARDDSEKGSVESKEVTSMVSCCGPDCPCPPTPGCPC